MASHLQGECPERGSEATESKGKLSGLAHGKPSTASLLTFACPASSKASTPYSDDGIVVLVHYFYILRCADAALYVGETAALDERMRLHNSGRGPTFTQIRRPVVLAYSETHDTRASALNRERQVKRWTRAKKEALVAGDLDTLKKL
jgi:putative endonuclease